MRMVSLQWVALGQLCSHLDGVLRGAPEELVGVLPLSSTSVCSAVVAVKLKKLVSIVITSSGQEIKWLVASHWRHHAEGTAWWCIFLLQLPLRPVKLGQRRLRRGAREFVVPLLCLAGVMVWSVLLVVILDAGGGS